MTGKRKIPEHGFSESYRFTSDVAVAVAHQWYAILVQQPAAALKDQTALCEHIAYNLAEDLVCFETVRNLSADDVRRLYEVAFTNIPPKTGTSVAVDKLLEQLRRGMCTNSSSLYLLMDCRSRGCKHPCREARDGWAITGGQHLRRGAHSND